MWHEARELLNPDGAVVLGVSSISAESRLFARRNVYRMTKHALADFILGYAYEEGAEQPNTSYATIYQGDTATSFGLKSVLPKSLNQNCTDLFEAYGDMTNAFLQSGMDLYYVADAYHKIYSHIVSKREERTVSCTDDMPVCTITVPQTFAVEPVALTPLTPLRTLEFNHHLVPPELVYECYGIVWDSMKAGFIPVFGDDRFDAMLDPRESLDCEAK